jgi:AcrR family transcriptional regulator
MAQKTAAAPAARNGGVRARTRALLLDAALRVFARKGAGAAALHEIAAEAGLANGTFYNYFRTREELVEAVSALLAERLFDAITASSTAVADPAERVAIGSRRFILQAMHDPTWGAALLRVWSSAPGLVERTAAPLLGDLRAGRRAGRFQFASQAAALDLVQGTVLAAMRTVLEGRADAAHPAQVATLVLRGLGVAAAEAERIARRPLPPIGGPGTAAVRPATPRRSLATRPVRARPR